MKQLKNNCRVSNLAVFPGNWESSEADLSLRWTISYRFYDDNEKESKRCIIKGMNKFKTLKQRQEDTRMKLKDETEALERGYNPITKYLPAPARDIPIDETTPLPEALNYVFNTKVVGKGTKKDLRQVKTHFIAAAKRLGLDQKPVSEFTRRHIKMILEDIGSSKPEFSNNNFNHHRRYTSILFKGLVELDFFDINPVEAISLKRTVKKKRQTLSPEERKIVNDFLYKNHYSFWRYLQIFFHSGCRSSELMNLKKEDIYFHNQQFTIVQKKGNVYEEVDRIIKTIIMPLWKEIYDLASPGQFLFSEGLVPGNSSIDPAQVSRRWRKHIKHKTDWKIKGKPGFKITADFYSLKHSNLDEITNRMDIKTAQKMAGHSSEEITRKYYAQGETERYNERLKAMENHFC